MKKLSLFLALVLSLCGWAKPVPAEKAKLVALHFLKSKSALISDVKLSHTYSSKSFNPNASSTPVNYFYIFTSGQQGFVLVAADDAAIPVIGYSVSDFFDAANIPSSVSKWFEEYKEQMRFIIDNGIVATPQIAEQWTELYSENYSDISIAAAAVPPLVATKWDQSPYYNALCPYDNGAGQRTVSGCVATGMAQIMKYWNYPASGTGFHSYNHDKYGTLSANFGSTSYNWGSMPNSVTSSNSAVATLMYHCGVSVDMNYGVAATGGSGAYVITDKSPVTHCSEYALKTYFGYKNTLKGVERVNYTTTSWLSLLKAELNASRPILYAGFGGGGGHCFVADGYDNSDYIHFNWGWGGNSDGYFQINALNPAALGAGGGSGGFNSGHQAVIGIEAPQGGGGGGGGAGEYTMKLNDYLLSPGGSTIYYGQAFDITTNIVNEGTNAFAGDYGVAVFDDQSNFVDFVKIISGATLPAGYTYNNKLTFSTTGLLSMLPGSYVIAAFYRPTGGDWKILGNKSSYINAYSFTVISAPTDIEMYAAFSKVGGGTTLTQDASLSIKLDIANFGNTAFNGTLDLSLFKLDGSYVTTIETKNNVSLSAQSHFTNGLTFTTSKLDAEPGTYLMALLYKETGSSNWMIVGSTSQYQNPIKVTVTVAPISADIYENNDQANKAYAMSISYTGNTGKFKTTGSNCHLGSDYDYYKLALPSGYTYTITARIHDKESATDGNTYTLDALFSYSDGSNWSDAYDDVLPNTITMEGGTTAYFLVSPYFTGETGTYILDVNVTRTPKSTGNITALNQETLSLYPNPCREFISIKSENGELFSEISVYDINGSLVLKTTPISSETKIETLNFAEGIYVISAKSVSGIVTKKFSVIK